MPSLVSDYEICEELSIFPGIEADEHYADFVSVSSFLSNKEAVLRGLQHLEAQLKLKGEALWKQSDHYRERRRFYQQEQIDVRLIDSILPGLILLHFDRADKKSFFKHLFSSTLTDLEVHEKFEVSGFAWAPRAQYYLGPVSPDLFREQILAGRPQGKDPFVDKGHGEYTHRLQWYAIMSPTSPIELQHPVVDVYKAVGRYIAPKGTYQESFQWGLWDMLCDRDNGTATVVPWKAVGELDFRCPNCLNSFLRSSGTENGLSMISAFLEGRYAKRAASKNPMDYAARKVFNKPVGDLSKKEEAILMEQVGGLKAVYDPVKGWR